ncbi:YafY family protein [Quadrisphaera sp. INWT6]|uniref:helix-turn-helix transcriptional regulator n=1 Tax=Quadrisphaera sp. INWT6 TaxID=2596917 RepID=UPI0018922850|nr:YafY family protein [Quadrisphaera sp. INWT6]MBF5081956.1 YafY family transcriptional regulator [Quadrisphaera sp. INWT6]
MANTSSRTLRLLSLLQARRHWPGGELADRLGVSPRTLRRDVDRLRELGYPVDATSGPDGGYRLAAGASLPPLALDDEEAVALAVALQGAASGSEGADGADGAAEPALRALAKVVQVMPPRLRRRVEALSAASVRAPWAAAAGPDPAVLLTVAQACRDAERLALAYTAADGARTERSVEPHGLVRLGRRWYVVVWDLGRGDWRTLRVDRVRDAAARGGRFRPRELPGPDAAAVVERSIRTAPALHAVTAVLHCSADEARSRLGGWAHVEPLAAQDDGGPPPQRCRLLMSTEDLDWAAFALVRARCDVSDVEPAALREHLATWVSRLSPP